MRKKFLWTVVITVLVTLCNRSNADPVTAYYDQASWDAAVAGLTVGEYTAGGTKTLYDDTISTRQPPCLPPAGLCVLSTTVTTSNFGVFDSLSAVMSYPTMCDVCTRTQSIVINFDQPILGFEVVDNSINQHAGLAVNGFELPSDPPFGPQFFGLVGPISSLTISVAGHTDNAGNLNWSSFRAVTIPEPFTLSLFGAGVLGASAIRRRKKTPNTTRPHRVD